VVSGQRRFDKMGWKSKGQTTKAAKMGLINRVRSDYITAKVAKVPDKQGRIRNYYEDGCEKVLFYKKNKKIN
jgi:hypothetical protein